MNYIKKIKELLEERIDVEDELLNLYTLLIIVKGKDTTLENVHDAWSIWMNNKDPKHKSLKPFKELTKEIQQYDENYAYAIQEVAKNLIN
jgi:hypothetical protein